MRFSLFKTVLIYGFSVLALLLASMNFFPDMKDGVFAHVPRLTLGLDLKGGSYLLLEVDAATVKKDRVEALRDEVRGKLRDGKIPTAGIQIQADAVLVKLRSPDDQKKVLEAVTPLAQVSQDILLGRTNKEVDIQPSGADAVLLKVTEQGITAKLSKAVEQSIAIVERRVNELGTVEPTIQRQGADRILLQVPGLQDPKRLRDLLGQTAKLSFRLVDTTVTDEALKSGKLSPELEALPNVDTLRGGLMAVQKTALVSGEDLVDAQASFDSRSNEPVVNFRFNTNGARKFGAATEQNVGKPFAIVLDNKVISAPVIREPIRGGSGQISGSFSVEGANDLAILLRAGALPAPLKVLEERTVGAGLGADSIAAGKLASIVAVAAVVCFMVISYGALGMMANIALVANLGLLISALSFFGATLTLPGIAGIVLTMGMAVDSNVLIYERIREEYRNGRSVLSAIEAGFERALGTIVDSNLTTLIAGLVLFMVGSGPVKGFAVTLSIGILTTLFTAYTLTRLIVANWYRLARPKTLSL